MPRAEWSEEVSCMRKHTPVQEYCRNWQSRGLPAVRRRPKLQHAAAVRSRESGMARSVSAQPGSGLKKQEAAPWLQQGAPPTTAVPCIITSPLFRYPFPAALFPHPLDWYPIPTVPCVGSDTLTPHTLPAHISLLFFWKLRFTAQNFFLLHFRTENSKLWWNPLVDLIVENRKLPRKLPHSFFPFKYLKSFWAISHVVV